MEDRLRYSLRRESDGAGDSGLMSRLLGENPPDTPRPTIGFGIAVGSPFARTYQMQDWWQTSQIVEILEDTPNRVRFRTLNSIYEWTQSE
jgi:hypothetical protein